MRRTANPTSRRSQRVQASDLGLCVLSVTLLWALGCGFPPERLERSVTLRVLTDPAGAQVAIVAAGTQNAVPLGAAPVTIEDLVIVRKRYSSGVIDYWLRDDGGSLPENPVKPPWASRPYCVGNDYPFDLVILAATPEGARTVEAIRLDRSTLEALFEEKMRELKVKLFLPAVPAVPAGEETPRAGEPQAGAPTQPPAEVASTPMHPETVAAAPEPETTPTPPATEDPAPVASTEPTPKLPEIPELPPIPKLPPPLPPPPGK